MNRTILTMSVTLLCAAALVAQTPLAPSTEFSISTSLNTDWDNIVVSDGATTYTIDLTSTTSSGTGTYGPIYPQGTDYLMEAFWTQVSSLTSGHMHFNGTGGNPGGWEDHHAQGTDRQGMRITRVDGMPFQLVSLDYRMADTPLEIVTTAFTSTPSYMAAATTFGAADGYLISNPNWNTYLFPSPVPIDVSPTAIVAPVNPTGSCDFLTTTEAITIDITNLGTSNLPAGTSINVAYSINGGAPITEALILAAQLDSLMTTTHTFATTQDLSMPGTYTIDVIASANGDQAPLNDLRSTTVFSGGVSGVTSLPWIENFDGFGSVNGGTIAPPGWEQDQTDAVGTDSDWYFRNTATTSGNGPPFDHTTGVSSGGFFAYVEDSSGNFPAVNLVTPCIDLGAATGPFLKFYIHSNNSSNPPTNFENFMAVDAITYPGGIVVTDLITPIGHQPSNQWEVVTADLTQFAGGTIQLRFRGRSDGGSSTHDIGIDDVEIRELLPANGEAPDPVYSSFNLNNATNVNGFPLSSGANGPYAATVTPGANLVYTFEGEPNQPVIVLAGPLNVALASYPGIGQIDIGTGIDPMSNLPTGIALLANGLSATGFNPFFNTGPTGTGMISFTMPNVPVGVLATFQCAIFNTLAVPIKMTNAITLSVN